MKPNSSGGGQTKGRGMNGKGMENKRFPCRTFPCRSRLGNVMAAVCESWHANEGHANVGRIEYYSFALHSRACCPIENQGRFCNCEAGRKVHY